MATEETSLDSENEDLTAEEILEELENNGDEAEESGGNVGDLSGATKTVKDVVIKSFNPGYSGVGEYLELGVEPGETTEGISFSLADLSVVYITSSGKEYPVFSFPEGYEMVGESLLMRLASSSEITEAEDEHEVADLIYTRNMAQSKGRIRLVYGEEVLDSLCWGFEEDECFSGFNAKKPTVLVRDFRAEEMEERFSHVALENYTLSYNPEKPGLKITEVEEEKIEPKCREIEFSEILTYFEASRDEQFIELYNRGDEKVELSGCSLRYKNKLYALSGAVEAKGLIVFYPGAAWDLQLTKNPTSANLLEIIDTDGEVDDSLLYMAGQRKGVSLAMMGYLADGRENWVQTYNVTPGAENVYQQYKSCPVGKRLNLETGNCVNEASPTTTLAACPEGKYRNPLTGRCKSYATTASAELKPCAEGYERNPATGRCRKIVENDGAEYPIEEEEFTERREFVSILAIIVVIVAGILYIIYQYREEIKGLVQKRQRKRRKTRKRLDGRGGEGYNFGIFSLRVSIAG